MDNLAAWMRGFFIIIGSLRDTLSSGSLTPGYGGDSIIQVTMN
jgi:hypothetical protein